MGLGPSGGLSDALRIEAASLGEGEIAQPEAQCGSGRRRGGEAAVVLIERYSTPRSLGKGLRAREAERSRMCVGEF